MHLQNRGSARAAYRRTLTACVAVAATLGISSALTPAVASPTDNVSALVRQMTTTQGDIDRLELLLGELREEVNRKLVDLDDAQGAAEQARQGAQAAGEALENSQSDLELAQGALDEIARATYRHGGGASTAPVSDLAGGDASRDMLDRQTFLRLRGEEQQRVVDELDGARTESANAESRARAATQLADARAAAAVAAEEDAQVSLEANVAELESVVAERDELIRQRDEAETQLAQQRGTAPAEVVAEAVEEPIAAEPPADEPQGEDPAMEATPTVADEIAARVAETQPDHESLSDPYQGEATESEAAEPATADETSGLANVAAFSVPAIAAVQAPTVRSTVSAEAEEANEEPVSTGEPATSATVEEETTEESATAESAQDSTEVESAGSSAGQAAGSSASLITEVAQLLEATSAEQTTGATTTGNSQQELPSAEEVATDLETLLPEVDTAESVSDAISSETDVTEESTPESSPDTSSETGSSPLIESVIARAESQLGTPYAWGGGNANGPTAGIRDGGTGDANGDYGKVGFDCSGFTLYAFAGAGISLPHYTGYQYQRGEHVDPQNMQRGDLIFYGPGGSQHVAIYLGDGMMIEAPSSGGVVQKTPVRWSGMAANAVRLI